jgi:hypothetical protein
MRNLSGILNNFSIFNLTVFTFILTGQIAQAKTPIDKTTRKPTENIQQASNYFSPKSQINPGNFAQLTSVSGLTIPLNQTNNLEIAQENIEIDPGTTTRSGSSYIGLGGNIGIDGETTIGQGAFAVISKIGLNDYLSFRPSALVEEDAAFLFPLTIDFLGRSVAENGFSIGPYVGAGLSLVTGQDDTVGIVVTGGLDIPISSQFTANTSVNVKFIDSTDVGILLGVGYNL